MSHCHYRGDSAGRRGSWEETASLSAGASGIHRDQLFDLLVSVVLFRGRHSACVVYCMPAYFMTYTICMYNAKFVDTLTSFTLLLEEKIAQGLHGKNSRG